MSVAMDQTTVGVIEELRALLGDRLSKSEAQRNSHGQDEGWVKPIGGPNR